MISKYLIGGMVLCVLAVTLIHRMIALEYQEQVFGIGILFLIGGVMVMGGFLEHGFKEARQLWKTGQLRKK